ncbi:2-oxoglutarate oxidoreductase subunit KorA [Hydrogenovibrio crunogenus]|uniref:2-oxoglutarate oxidoreductase subunit KorA n=1 Tax=Hydrogenovibrio crunogenus TaxID=39765 RepID=A0A4P7P0R4_9GAMM|nr:2-oxoacid:acceptor oxidoreductase subunit alpha [Hydrogenovibrio crunogenus]QBZ83741.1 2-oxoglutarate oxidoreductase subunit KorA [Hydrogenovibrio crunogenus]
MTHPVSVSQNTLAISVSGSGGTGAVTVGLILLEAVAKAGFYGVMTRSFGPQIRGGESAVMLNLSDQPIETLAEFSHIHLALDWLKFERFADEIPLTQDSLVIYDNSREKPPGLVESSGAKLIGLALQNAVKTIQGSRMNMFALGVLAQQIGLDSAFIESAVKKTLGKKGDAVITPSLEAIQAGRQLISNSHFNVLSRWQSSNKTRWNISGNEACGLGALRGGLKLAAAYPITPATDIVEYLAPRIEKLGGRVLIAEDELAAMNMVIGGSFGGYPSMTATSGPGFSLMTEAMGLAIASETPALVVTVMRGGPSTGIPTKSEQTDLNQVLYGFHGEAPHVVTAPLNVQEMVTVSQWSLGLAETLQTLVVEVSDQHLGQSRVIIDPVPPVDFNLNRLHPPATPSDYQRYQLTQDAISPMAWLGTPETQYTADGLEHTETGKPSSAAKDHQQQLTKRSQKITQFDYGERWAKRTEKEDANEMVITWGSTYEAVRVAVDALNKQGARISLLGLRLLMPLQTQKIQALCKDKTVIVIEQNASGQLFHYLLSDNAIPRASQSIAETGPVLFKPSTVQAALTHCLEAIK